MSAAPQGSGMPGMKVIGLLAIAVMLVALSFQMQGPDGGGHAERVFPSLEKGLDEVSRVVITPASDGIDGGVTLADFARLGQGVHSILWSLELFQGPAAHDRPAWTLRMLAFIAQDQRFHFHVAFGSPVDVRQGAATSVASGSFSRIALSSRMASSIRPIVAWISASVRRWA